MNELKCEERKFCVKERFVVMQGTFTQSGMGDGWSDSVYDCYDEAERQFNLIKENIKGIVRHANGYIGTWIERQIWNEEAEEWDVPEDGFDIIEYYEIKINSFGLPKFERG